MGDSMTDELRAAGEVFDKAIENGGGARALLLWRFWLHLYGDRVYDRDVRLLRGLGYVEGYAPTAKGLVALKAAGYSLTSPRVARRVALAR